jgi:hypothetical protein
MKKPSQCYFSVDITKQLERNSCFAHPGMNRARCTSPEHSPCTTDQSLCTSRFMHPLVLCYQCLQSRNGEPKDLLL